MPDDLADYHAYPQPEWNGADSVSAAVGNVMQAHDEKSSSSAYNRLLHALGNNHAGTYFPVVLAAMPALEKILRSGKPWPQRTVLEALIDLLTSFQPDPAHGTLQGASLSAALRERILALKPLLGSLSTDNSMTNKSVQDLLHCLDDSTQLNGFTLDSA